MSVLARVGIAAALMFAAGCGSSGGGRMADKAEGELALGEVAEMVRATTRPDGRGPAKATDFDRLKSQFPRGSAAVSSGAVVVLWGAGLQGEGAMAGGGGSVVAYEKDAATAGGFVLLSSGEVKKMTAGEFSSAPKADKK